MRDTIRTKYYKVAVYLLLGAALCTIPKLLEAQECPNSGSCNAVVGSLALSSISTPTVPNRVLHMEQPSPDGLFTDNAILLTYNRSSWNPDDVTQPSASLDLESYWNGHSEMNIDVAAPNTNAYIRPLGFEAMYDGSETALQIGGGAYASGAAGVRLEGGSGSLSSLITVQDRIGRTAPANMLEMLRSDGSASFVWRAGGVPRLDFGLAANANADWAGNYGVLKFAGEWDYGEPIIHFESVGIEARLLDSYPASTDTNPRFNLFANGNIDWGSGASPVDTDLYRSATGTLRTDGSFVVGGNLMVIGSKAALVQTTSYGKREVYAVESPNEWFEDFGSGRLIRGRSFIRIDPVFGQTVTTGHDYHVYLTANGPCSLYVERKQADGFKVRSLGGSKSCGFDYRLIAKRKGYESVRLAKIGDEK